MVETYYEMNKNLRDLTDLQGKVVELIIRIKEKSRRGGKVDGLMKEKRVLEEKLKKLRADCGL
ncbi:MAG: hypothetical protein A2430_01240 [Candidatus Liptonbacteria bacterium RIFOXYC1_FULL_36_8]|uniref:Uncharacterized protein n=2 Tax=Candidatus Liptoniibacteriota TaxID=1817909 RepID=A0A1G2CPW0_9BACT|nr:MAG: hypothetical protein A2430_01240 [Candidatus Liptonbacteria bacterium RIFOXYC1_FULL_36_8]OGZ03415.1 MAG: hypothetical protein A2390_00660 [Candidatus Liptonbacteria bacterium RIFOXYB1_FULL_36_10]